MFLSRIKQFFSVWRECFQSVREMKLFVPFVLFAIIQFVCLLLLLNFYRYPVNNILVPVMRLIAGEKFLHYPDSFIVLPLLFNYTNIILSGLIGTVIIGSSTFLFAGKFQKKVTSVPQGFKIVSSKYLILFVLWLMETLLVLAVIVGLPALLQDMLKLEYIEMRYTQAACFFLGLFIASIFAYTTAAVVLDNQGIIRSFLASTKIFGKHIVVTFLLVFIPNIANLPFNYASGKTFFILQKFNPEIVFILIALTIVVSIITNFFMVATITRYYLIQKTH